MQAESSGIEVKIMGEGVGEARGILRRHLSPRTVAAIVKNLPLEGRAATWRGKVYFKIPLELGVEKPRGHVEGGMIAYWPMGTALCVFLEPCQPYSPVNIIGEIRENLEVFKGIREGSKLRVERV